MTDTEHPPGDAPAYQVLARKYRPDTFADLVGQEAMVRTLTNAFAADRIAQAFLLTGIRGTGKTTTARIIAKGLNCTGPEGDGGPTTQPCGVCPQCRGVARGQHVDVIEMDAASNTGIDNIRANVIDSVTYAPAASRYKIFIIDEVHMLSTSAFNALLKTLEEPPPHVKFVFATTEIRKVPVTVLSRCQRFDLRRIEPETIIDLLARIAEAEGAEAEPDALALIARAAEGSARDAISLLDQALALAGARIAAEEVRAMLGVADRGRVLDLFDLLMRGAAAEALAELRAQHLAGADPEAVLRDLAEVAHWLAVVKLTPQAAEDPTATPDARSRGRDMAGRLSQRVLSRTWQMLLKALEEVAAAPDALMAAEMALIRLTHMADLPTPDTLIRQLLEAPSEQSPADGASGPADAPRAGNGPSAGPPQAAPAPSGNAAPSAQAAGAGSAREGPERASPRQANRGAAADMSSGGAAALGALARPGLQTAAAALAEQGPTPAPDFAGGVRAPELRATQALARYASFGEVVELIRANRDIKLLVDVETGVRLVSYSPGRIAFAPAEDAPADLASRLGTRLQTWTGVRWTVAVEAGPGAPTIAEARGETDRRQEAEASAHPLVAAALAAFPGARITEIRSADDIAAEAESAALPAPDDNWDPFEAD